MVKHTQQQISARVFKIWKEYGFPHPAEIEIEDLAMERGVLVIEGDIKGAEGRLMRKKGAGIAHIRKGIPFLGRRRFTIAHELGHWELHEGQSQFICSATDMRDYKNSQMEVEANHFAAELLMPPHHLRKAIERQEPSMGLIKRLAEEFGTTLTATAIRFVDCTKYKMIVVWAEGGTIRWSYRNEKTTSLYVAAGRNLPAYSSATLPEDQLSNEMDYYDQANWFPQLQRGVGEVMEETLRMNQLGTSLTILWLT